MESYTVLPAAFTELQNNTIGIDSNTQVVVCGVARTCIGMVVLYIIIFGWSHAADVLQTNVVDVEYCGGATVVLEHGTLHSYVMVEHTLVVLQSCWSMVHYTWMLLL